MPPCADGFGRRVSSSLRLCPVTPPWSETNRWCSIVLRQPGREEATGRQQRGPVCVKRRAAADEERGVIARAKVWRQRRDGLELSRGRGGHGCDELVVWGGRSVCPAALPGAVFRH